MFYKFRKDSVADSRFSNKYTYCPEQPEAVQGPMADVQQVGMQFCIKDY